LSSWIFDGHALDKLCLGDWVAVLNSILMVVVRFFGFIPAKLRNAKILAKVVVVPMDLAM